MPFEMPPWFGRAGVWALACLLHVLGLFLAVGFLEARYARSLQKKGAAGRGDQSDTCDALPPREDTDS